MKTKFKQALMIVAVIFWGTSCGDDAEDKPESRIATDVTSLTFEHGGGSLQLAVQSNTDWTIDKSGCAWVTVNTLAGSGDQTITVTAPKNTGTHRTGKIILRADDKSKEVDITQYSAVLSFGVPSVSAVLKSNLPITDETHLVIPYSGGIGNESFTVSVTTTATGINAVNNFAITLSAPAGEILVPLSGTPVTAGEATFNITVSYTHPTTGEPVVISPLTVTVEAGATLVVGTLSLSENNLIYTKSVGDNLRLLLPYSDALGIEVFTLSIAVSGEAAPGVVTENVFDVTITQPGNGTIEIPVTGTPYKAGTVNFAVTGDEDSRTFTLDAAEINQSMNATVTDNGKRYYNGAFVISGVMSDPRGSDAPAAGDGATFNNPHMEGEKKHSGGYEYMQFLALEEINFAQTPYSVIVTNTPNNTAGPAGWMEGGARTYKFNLTEGTVSKGEFFYVGGTAKALGGYRNDAVDNVTNWPNVPVGITSMANSKWIRTIAFNGNDGDDGIGSSINGIFLNYHATQNRFNSIAVFKGTAVENNSIPIDAVFFGKGDPSVIYFKPATPSRYLTVPLNDLYNPVEGYFGQGTNTTVLPAHISARTNQSEFMKFGGKLSIDASNNKVWLESRATTGIVLNDPGLFIGAPGGDDVVISAADKYDPAKESEENPYLSGYTKRLATIADIETIGGGITTIVNE